MAPQAIARQPVEHESCTACRMALQHLTLSPNVPAPVCAPTTHACRFLNFFFDHLDLAEVQDFCQVCPLAHHKPHSPALGQSHVSSDGPRIISTQPWLFGSLDQVYKAPGTHGVSSKLARSITSIFVYICSIQQSHCISMLCDCSCLAQSARLHQHARLLPPLSRSTLELWPTCCRPPTPLAGMQACLRCRGAILFTGVGKSGFIAQKIAQTLVSTGTKAFALNPTDALHGDLGILGPGDLVVTVSKSGSTEELLRLVPFAKVGTTLASASGCTGSWQPRDACGGWQ